MIWRFDIDFIKAVILIDFRVGSGIGKHQRLSNGNWRLKKKSKNEITLFLTLFFVSQVELKLEVRKSQQFSINMSELEKCNFVAKEFEFLGVYP